MKEKIPGFVEKNSKELFSAFVLAITFFLFAPISVFIKNAESISFSFDDIWVIYFAVTILAVILLSLAVLCSKLLFRNIAVVFTALSLILIVEGNFLNYNLGTLNGQDILWQSFTVQLWVEIIFWIALITIFIIFRRFFYKNLNLILILLVVYQISAVAISVITNPLPQKEDKVYFSTDKEFEFSQTNNVILIILDTFRSEAFNRIVDKYPEYKQTFSDFTFYQDALGGYTTTLPSLPLVLTGKYYDNSSTISEFLDETQEIAIPALLKDNGFTVENYSFVPFYSSTYDNLSSTLSFTERKELVGQQYALSGIRYMPLVFKQLFVTQFYEGLNYVHKDIDDFEKQIETTQIIDKAPTFKLIHLSGAHSPYQQNHDLEHGNFGYIEQAAASLKIVADLLAELKAVGAYDNSLIIIIGDHGSTNPLDYSGPPLTYSSQVLMLVKRMDQHSDDLQYSDARVSISDIPKTIAEETGTQNTYDGYSIFNTVPDDRSRVWYYYSWKNSNWRKLYLPTLYKFDILGAADQQSSYTLSSIITSKSITSVPVYHYHYGDDLFKTILSDSIYIKFYSTNFTYDKAEPSGWSWATGPEACLYLPVELTISDLSLSISATPFLVGDMLPSQAMNILIDNTPLSYTINDNQIIAEISNDLAKDATSDGHLDLCFEFPDATKSPKDFGISEDKRLLGYMFTSIILDEK